MISADSVHLRLNGEEILKNVNFVGEKGKITCLLGPNGAGKTSLLKCLNGIYNPDKGNISINGRNISKLNRREIARQVSYIPQYQSTSFSFQVLDFIIMGRAPYLSWGQKPGVTEEKRALSVLADLGIIKLAERHFNTLSGGEKRMVLLARALIQDAEYLLLDEPDAHLDFKNTHEQLGHLNSIAKTKTKGIIITLHNPNLARKYSHQAFLIKKGRIITSGNSEEVFTAPWLENLYDVPFASVKNHEYYPVLKEL